MQGLLCRCPVAELPGARQKSCARVRRPHGKPRPNSHALTVNPGSNFSGPQPNSRPELTRYPPRIAQLREILLRVQVAFAHCREELVLLVPLKVRWENSAV